MAYEEGGTEELILKMQAQSTIPFIELDERKNLKVSSGACKLIFIALQIQLRSRTLI